MEYNIYLDSSVVTLKPQVLNLFNIIVRKVKEARDLAVVISKKELSLELNKDPRTVSRYIAELGEHDVIEYKSKRGRNGGTVVRINTDKVRFETSKDALVTTDDVESMEEAMERKMPKKDDQFNDKKKSGKRNRRTKQEMLESQILAEKTNNKNDILNKEVESLGGVPNWAWFEKTDDPVGNYKTYLITRLYNRYSVLFTDMHNAEVDVYGRGNKVSKISGNYDVLDMHFMGTSRWAQFEQLRLFCETNNIDPAVYLTAQFNRSLFVGGNRGAKNILPYINALISDTAYKVYLDYSRYQDKVSVGGKSGFGMMAKFMEDFVVSNIYRGYENAEKSQAVDEFKPALREFLYNESPNDPKHIDLANFYDLTVSEMKKNNVSPKSRSTIRKYLLMQSMMVVEGGYMMPEDILTGSELMRAILVKIDQTTPDKEGARNLKSLALGALANPTASREKQMEDGSMNLYRLERMNEAPQVMKLVYERLGLHVSVSDVNSALKEYGVDKIPVDDYSVLDVNAIVEFMNREDSIEEDIDVNSYLEPKPWEMREAVVVGDREEDFLADILTDVGL